MRLAALGMDVLGVDPVGASPDVARGKPCAQHFSWVNGDATALPGRHLAADLAVMTGNVAQVLVSDDDWAGTLDAVRACLRPNGWIVFETRLPRVRDEQGWDAGPIAVMVRGGTDVVVSRTVTEVEPPLVTVTSTAGIDGEVRDAPDRPARSGYSSPVELPECQMSLTPQGRTQREKGTTCGLVHRTHR